MLKSGLVLVAEDDPNDRLLLERALRKAAIEVQMRFVSDGEEAILYLQGAGAYANRQENPFPSIIILDLKMPRKGGLEVLSWIEDHPELSVVPTVVLTSSNLETDIRLAYERGANTYFMKPNSFDELVGMAKVLQEYWNKAERINPSPRIPKPNAD
jgi:CheY-like chemotaxis protein